MNKSFVSFPLHSNINFHLMFLNGMIGMQLFLPNLWGEFFSCSCSFCHFHGLVTITVFVLHVSRVWFEALFMNETSPFDNSVNRNSVVVAFDLHLYWWYNWHYLWMKQVHFDNSVVVFAHHLIDGIVSCVHLVFRTGWVEWNGIINKLERCGQEVCWGESTNRDGDEAMGKIRTLSKSRLICYI